MDHLGGTIVLQAIPAQKLLIEAVKSYASLQHVKSRGTFFRKLMCKQNRLPLHQKQHTIMGKVKQETISINKDTELAKRFRDYCEQRNLSRPEALRQLMNDAQCTIDIEGFMNRVESVLSNVEKLLSDMNSRKLGMQDTTELVSSEMTAASYIPQETNYLSVDARDFIDESNKRQFSEPANQSSEPKTLYYANGLVRQVEGSEVRYFNKGKHAEKSLIEVIREDTAYIDILLKTADSYNSNQRFALSSKELQLYKV